MVLVGRWEKRREKESEKRRENGKLSYEEVTKNKWGTMVIYETDL